MTSIEIQVPSNVAAAEERVTAPVEVTSADSAADAPEIHITVEGGGSATVEIPVTNVTPGTVAVVVNPDGSETVLRDCVVTENGIVLPVDGSVTVKIIENGRSFADAERVSWAKDAIAFTTARELFQGIDDTTFAPHMSANRAMVVTLLYRLEYEPVVDFAGFADVGGNSWYADAVAWAKMNGVVEGYNSREFGPKDAVTRQQLVVILYRYAKLKGMDTTQRADLSAYKDGGSVSSWAREAMEWAVAGGLIEGHGDGRIDPAGNATRAQVAVVLMRFCLACFR